MARKKERGFLHILRTKCKAPKDFSACASAMKKVRSKLKGMEFPEAVKYLMEAGNYVKDVTPIVQKILIALLPHLHEIQE